MASIKVFIVSRGESVLTGLRGEAEVVIEIKISRRKDSLTVSPLSFLMNCRYAPTVECFCSQGNP